MFLYLFLLFFMSIPKIFFKKLVVLIMIEISFLSLIVYMLVSSWYNFSFFLFFILCLFMVIDSVFGISLLISCGRNSNFSSSSIFYI